VGLPQVLAYYCHALSGGIPRDLIRFARLCIDTRRQAASPILTSTVVADASKQHVLSLLDGAVVRAKENQSESFLSLSEVKRAVEDTDGASLFPLLDRAADFLLTDFSETHGQDLVAAALPATLATIGTAGSYFGRVWTVGGVAAGDGSGQTRTFRGSSRRMHG